MHYFIKNHPQVFALRFFDGQPNPPASNYQLRAEERSKTADLRHRKAASRRNASFLHHLRPHQLPALQLERGQGAERQVWVQSSADGQCRWRHQRQLQIQCIRSGHQSAMAVPQQKGSARSLLPKAGDRQQQETDCFFSGHPRPQQEDELFLLWVKDH